MSPTSSESSGGDLIVCCEEPSLLGGGDGVAREQTEAVVGLDLNLDEAVSEVSVSTSGSDEIEDMSTSEPELELDAVSIDSMESVSAYSTANGDTSQSESDSGSTESSKDSVIEETDESVIEETDESVIEGSEDSVLEETEESVIEEDSEDTVDNFGVAEVGPPTEVVDTVVDSALTPEMPDLEDSPDEMLELQEPHEQEPSVIVESEVEESDYQDCYEQIPPESEHSEALSPLRPPSSDADEAVTLTRPQEVRRSQRTKQRPKILTYDSFREPRIARHPGYRNYNVLNVNFNASHDTT